jgi:hypothetical protein
MSEAAIIWAEGLGAREQRLSRGLDALDIAILSKLASVADDDDCGWMRVDDLADRAGTSVRNVQYRLRKLQGMDWVKGKERIAPLIADTGRTYRRGTREIPIYELAVDHLMVAAVLQRRRARRDEAAMVASSGPAAMGATVCTHEADEACEVCTPMGATGCTPKEPIRTEDRASALSGGARGAERGDDEGEEGSAEGDQAAVAAGPAFREAFRRWSPLAMQSTSWAPAMAEWAVQAAEAGGDEALLACVVAYLDHPSIATRKKPLKGFQYWLREGGWRAVAFAMEAASEGGASLPRAGWTGPAEVRALVVSAYGENTAAAYLLGCDWDAEQQVVRTRTGTAFRALSKLWSSSLPWTLAEPSRTAG